MKAACYFVVALALTGCAARQSASSWTLPADLSRGSARELVVDAASAGRLSDLMAAAEETVFNSDEARMAELLRAALETGKLTEEETATAEWMLHDVCEVNAPGSQAADFMFGTQTRASLRMSEYLAGKPLVLFFYDPDCDHCKEVMGELGSLGSKVDVLAVCITGNERRWRQTAGQLPSDWVAAFDRSDIMANDIYVLRRMPSVYLLDSERRVVMKNPEPEKLLNYLDSSK